MRGRTLCCSESRRKPRFVAEHLSEQRVAGALWFGNMGDMVEHDPRRQILKQRNHGGKIAGPDIDLDMPAERFYAPRQGRDHRSGDRRGGAKLKRNPRTPRASSCLSSASPISGVATAMPRAWAPNMFSPSSSKRLSVP